MHKIFVLLTPIFLMASCHGGADRPPVEARMYHLRLNPPDSSSYRYNTASEITIAVIENDSAFGVHRTTRFAVDYLISKDSDEIMMDMTFGGIEYHERKGLGVQAVDAADEPGPMRELLKRMKTTTIFGRVRPASSLVTMSGAQELVNSVMDSYYVAADRSQAAEYWGQWVEQQLVWKNLDPFVWVSLDSARRPGAHWTDISTNAEDINFKINKRYRFDAVNAAIATIRSRGRISNDSGGTLLWGKPVTGVLSGTEDGKCLVDMSTGMPREMEDTIIAEGNVQIEGRQAQLKIVKTIKMAGGKLK